MKECSFGTFHGINPEFDSMKVSVTITSLDWSFEAELLKWSTVPKGYLKLPRPIDKFFNFATIYSFLIEKRCFCIHNLKTNKFIKFICHTNDMV
jgi:hypothetical protein